MKRFGLAALFAIAAALFTSSPALAQYTIDLTFTANAKDRDHGASGKVTLTDVTYDGMWIVWDWDDSTLSYGYDVYTGYLTLRCDGLTPGATYRLGPTDIRAYDPYSYVAASSTGTVDLNVQVYFSYGYTYYWVEDPFWGGHWERWPGDPSGGFGVSVARRQGRRNYTEVLSGWLFP
jgi:hypothetical protein